MAEMWNAVAGGWERHADIVDEHLRQVTADLLDAAGVAPGTAVLDVAAGPGGAGLAAAARVGEGGRVVLADIAPAMVEVAARRAATLPQVGTAACAQEAIDFPDASFDAVLCRHGLMFVQPPADAVREAARVLRPGGRYAAMTWSARAENPWLGTVLDAVGEHFGMPFPPPGVPGPFALDEPGLLEAALREGGLSGVRVERRDAPMRAASLEEWWARVPALAGPLELLLAGMEPEVRDAIRARAVERASAHARAAGDGIEMDGAVLVGSGRRA